MFEREQHRKVIALLSALDNQTLSRCKFLFGGGTRIVLELDEYRESHDVDFLCSDPEGYSELRFAVSKGGYPSLFRRDAGKSPLRALDKMRKHAPRGGGIETIGAADLRVPEDRIAETCIPSALHEAHKAVLTFHGGLVSVRA